MIKIFEGMIFIVLIALFSPSLCHHHHETVLIQQQDESTFEPILYSFDELPLGVTVFEPETECSILPSRLCDVFLPEYGASFFSDREFLELIFHQSPFADPVPSGVQHDGDEVHTDVPPEFMICPEYLLEHHENDETFFNDFLPVGKLSSRLVDTEELQILGYSEEHIFSHSKMKVCLRTSDEFYKPLKMIMNHYSSPEMQRTPLLLDSLCDDEHMQAEDLSYLIIHQLIGEYRVPRTVTTPPDHKMTDAHYYEYPVPPVMIRADGTLNALSPHSMYFGSGVVLGPVFTDHSQYNLPVHEVDLVIVEDDGSSAIIIFHDGTCLELRFRVVHENCEGREDKTIVEVRSIGLGDLQHPDLPLFSIVGRHHNDSVTETSAVVIDGELVFDLDSLENDLQGHSNLQQGGDDMSGRPSVIIGKRFSFTRNQVTFFKPNSTVVSVRRLSDEGHHKTYLYYKSKVSLNLHFGGCLSILIVSVLTCLIGGMVNALSLCCCWTYHKVYKKSKDFLTSLDDALPNNIEEEIDSMEENCLRTSVGFVKMMWRNIIKYWIGVFVYYVKNFGLCAACVYELFMVIVSDSPMIYSDYELSRRYLLSCLWILSIVQGIDLIFLSFIDNLITSGNVCVKWITEGSRNSSSSGSSGSDHRADDAESLEPLLITKEDEEEYKKSKRKKRWGVFRKMSDACCCHFYVTTILSICNTLGVILVIVTLFIILTDLEEYWIFYHRDGVNYEIGNEVKFLIAFNVVYVALKVILETSVSCTRKCLMFSGVQRKCAKVCCKCCIGCLCRKKKKKKKKKTKKEKNEGKLLSDDDDDDDSDALFDKKEKKRFEDLVLEEEELGKKKREKEVSLSSSDVSSDDSSYDSDVLENSDEVDSDDDDDDDDEVKSDVNVPVEIVL